MIGTLPRACTVFKHDMLGSYFTKQLGIILYVCAIQFTKVYFFHTNCIWKTAAHILCNIKNCNTLFSRAQFPNPPGHGPAPVWPNRDQAKRRGGLCLQPLALSPALHLLSGQRLSAEPCLKDLPLKIKPDSRQSAKQCVSLAAVTEGNCFIQEPTSVCSLLPISGHVGCV